MNYKNFKIVHHPETIKEDWNTQTGNTGRILAVPGLEADHVDASLFHEAAIGKIAGEQLTKLMNLGLTEAEAEEQIINGFLR